MGIIGWDTLKSLGIGQTDQEVDAITNMSLLILEFSFMVQDDPETRFLWSTDGEMTWPLVLTIFQDLLFLWLQKGWGEREIKFHGFRVLFVPCLI